MTSNLHKQAREYYALCDRAASKGVPVSLDDPRSPRTVASLRKAAAEAVVRDPESWQAVAAAGRKYA